MLTAPGLRSTNGLIRPREQVSLQQVTPDMALRWLETMPYEHQRRKRQVWVDFLAEEIRRGNFKQGTQIQIAYLNGRPMLIDGQHRLQAVISAGIAQSFAVYEMTANDSDHVAWLYANTDIGLRRTASDLYSALDLPTELGLTRSQIDAMSSTVSFMMNGLLYQNDKTRPHRDELLASIRLYAPYAREFFELLAGHPEMYRPCKRSATLVIALLTMRFSAPYAAQRGALSPVEFWNGVVGDDGIKASDPRKFAHRHLITGQMMAGRKIGVQSFTPMRSARILGSCFNSYIAQRELAQMPKVLDESAPLSVYGVPRDPAAWLK